MKISVGTSLMPWQVAQLDDMAGTIYGETRAEVLRFIVMHWLLHNGAAVDHQIERRREYDRQHTPSRP